VGRRGDGLLTATSDRRLRDREDPDLLDGADPVVGVPIFCRVAAARRRRPARPQSTAGTGSRCRYHGRIESRDGPTVMDVPMQPAVESPMMSSIADRLRRTHPLFWIYLLLSLVLMTLILFPSGTRTDWVCHTDLQGVLVVVDADTTLPINGATIHFREANDGGGFCLEEMGEDREKAFTLTTDSVGKATRKWTSCMCAGSDSESKSTFYIHLPCLWYQVSAPGYSTSEWSYLDDAHNHGQVRREPGLATLEVKIPLYGKPFGRVSKKAGDG
jgi:hypothetical protein